MVNYYIYAKDFSGSTEGEQYYHTNGLETLKQFKSDVKKIEKELLISDKQTESKVIYLHWNSLCCQVDEDVIRQTYTECKSGGTRTEPESIVQWIRKYTTPGDDYRIKLLYMVTDGMIDEDGVTRCFELNDNIEYETVVFHAFNKNLFEVDLSVAASFFKKRCNVYLNNEILDDVDISQEFNYNKDIKKK